MELEAKDFKATVIISLEGCSCNFRRSGELAKLLIELSQKSDFNLANINLKVKEEVSELLINTIELRLPFRLVLDVLLLVLLLSGYNMLQLTMLMILNELLYYVEGHHQL